MREMLNKKGVTETILVIGALIIAAFIITLGATRFIAPFIKTSPDYSVLDAKLSLETVYAAPDDMLYRFLVAVPKTRMGTCGEYDLWIEKKMFKAAVTCGGIDASGKSQDFISMPLSSCGMKKAGYSDNRWRSDSGKPQTINMQKIYNNTNSECNLTIGKW